MGNTFDTQLDYIRLAKLLNQETSGDFKSEFKLAFCQQQTFAYFGPVKAKERPRHTKRGGTYTPKATAQFENNVKEWGVRLFDRPVGFPVSVTLTIRETDASLSDADKELAWYNLIHNKKGDLDNLCKSVFDGLNGVLYRDDKQIVQMTVRRRYDRSEGFDLTVRRAGLSAHESTTLLRAAGYLTATKL